MTPTLIWKFCITTLQTR